jgi:hypothetical protein
MSNIEKIDKEIVSIYNRLAFDKIVINSNYSTQTLNTQKILADLYNKRIEYKNKIKYLNKKKERIQKLNIMLNDRF